MWTPTTGWAEYISCLRVGRPGSRAEGGVRPSTGHMIGSGVSELENQGHGRFTVSNWAS